MTSLLPDAAQSEAPPIVTPDGRDDLQRRADEIDKGNRAQDTNENRCPVCGGLTPGDITHARC
jgi:hypothetical protein